MNLQQLSTAEDWAAWVNEHEWDIFGTLNFTQHHKPSLKRADKLWRLFWNTIDRAVYGKRVRYGDRVERMVFMHAGADSDNPHIHFVTKSPINTVQFCILLNAAWTSLCNDTAGPAANELLPVIEQQRAVDYMLHDHWRIGTDTFCEKISHVADIGFAPKARDDAFDRLAQLSTNTWLWRADEAYDTHLNNAHERYNRRSH